jgi:hypothetical protein
MSEVTRETREVDASTEASTIPTSAASHQSETSSLPDTTEQTIKMASTDGTVTGIPRTPVKNICCVGAGYVGKSEISSNSHKLQIQDCGICKLE